MYAIRGYCHSESSFIASHSFQIDLAPEWKNYVAKSGITQKEIDNLLNVEGPRWLNAVGFKHHNDPHWNVGKHLDVQWGDWGPEHIEIPGNACGLDINQKGELSICLFDEGRCLLPHNMDTLQQKYLVTIVFTTIAELILGNGED